MSVTNLLSSGLAIICALVFAAAPLAAQDIETRGKKDRSDGGGKGKIYRDRQAVASAVFDHVAYDARKSVLTLYFDHGGVYKYDGVPAAVHTRLMTTDCIGCFFNREIRGAYPFQRLKQ